MDTDTPMDTDTVTAMELDTTLATAMDTMVATTAMDTVSAMATATTDKLELSLLIVQYCAIIIVLKIDLSNSPFLLTFFWDVTDNLSLKLMIAILKMNQINQQIFSVPAKHVLVKISKH